MAQHYTDPTTKLTNDFWANMNATVLMFSEARRRRAGRNRQTWQSAYRSLAIAKRQGGASAMAVVARRFGPMDMLYVAKACSVAKAKRGGTLTTVRALQVLKNLRAA